MPRVKSSEQIQTLERKRKELLGKLKTAKAKEREKAKETEEHKAIVAGRIVLAELANNPDGGLATTFRLIADRALNRPADRALFNLSESSEAAVPPSAAKHGETAAAQSVDHEPQPEKSGWGRRWLNTR